VLSQQQAFGGLCDSAINRTIGMHAKAGLGVRGPATAASAQEGEPSPPASPAHSPLPPPSPPPSPPKPAPADPAPATSGRAARIKTVPLKLRKSNSPPPSRGKAGPAKKAPRSRSSETPAAAAVPPPVPAGKKPPQKKKSGAKTPVKKTSAKKTAARLSDSQDSDKEEERELAENDGTGGLLCKDSPKLLVAQRLICACLAVGERVVVISERILPLKMLAQELNTFARMQDDVSEKDRNYCVIDASMTGDHRRQIFEDLSTLDTAVRVALVSKRIGNAGITLNAFSRMIIFDVHFTPSVDAQCMGRIYRYGQTRPVVFYRLVAADTLEEAIMRRQGSKTSAFAGILSCTVTHARPGPKPDVSINTKPPVLTHQRPPETVVALDCDFTQPVFDDAVLQAAFSPAEGARASGSDVLRVEQPASLREAAASAPHDSNMLRMYSVLWQQAAKALKSGPKKRAAGLLSVLRWRCDVCCAPMRHTLKPDYEAEAEDLDTMHKETTLF